MYNLIFYALILNIIYIIIALRYYYIYSLVRQKKIILLNIKNFYKKKYVKNNVFNIIMYEVYFYYIQTFTTHSQKKLRYKSYICYEVYDVDNVI